MIKPAFVFSLMVSLFLVYSFSIYTRGNEKDQSAHEINDTVAKGRLVWQKYNCQSCHQLYGLGGFLGPDLTNLMATPTKNKIFLNAMLLSGIKQMPVFTLSNEELNDLFDFLTDVNKTGKASPSSFEVLPNGMIKYHE